MAHGDPEPNARISTTFVLRGRQINSDRERFVPSSVRRNMFSSGSSYAFDGLAGHVVLGKTKTIYGH